jgi:hypothetical protein
MMIELLLAGAMLQAVPNVKNPTAVSFKCVDHDRDTGHDILIVDNATGTTLQTIAGGDPALDVNGDVTIPLNVQPVAFGTYHIKVRVLAGALSSDLSTPSNVWERVPGAPSKPVVK